MPEPKGKFGCAPGDEVQHFFTLANGEFTPACDPNGTIVGKVGPGGDKPLCPVCVSIVGVS